MDYELSWRKKEIRKFLDIMLHETLSREERDEYEYKIQQLLDAEKIEGEVKVFKEKREQKSIYNKKRLIRNELVIISILAVLSLIIMARPVKAEGKFEPSDYILAVEDENTVVESLAEPEEKKNTIPEITTGKSIFFTNGGAIRIEKSKNIRVEASKVQGDGEKDIKAGENQSVQTKSEGSEREKEGESKKTP